MDNETPDLSHLCSSLGEFSWWLFEGCAKQGRTRMTFEHVLDARLIEGRRKTHQPAGARLALDASDADGLRQRINRAYLNNWDDSRVRRRLHRLADAAVPDAIAFVIDDTGIVKKGVKSPGVHRQYTGTAGKVENCQIVVSTHLASESRGLPLEMDLYLPSAWTDDLSRCQDAGIPDDIEFRTKPDIALDQLDDLLAAGVGKRVVVADAGYGDKTNWRKALDERGLEFVVDVASKTKFWRPNEGPDPAPEYEGRGRPPKRRFPGEFQPITVRDLADELEDDMWEVVELREGSKVRTSRFAAVRGVRSAHRAVWGREPGKPRILVVEWPEDLDSPSHFFISNLPLDTPLETVARLGKLRWRVERDYQDLKQDLGFTHYEGRTWTGFTHHLTISMAAMTYVVACQALFPPQP
tara:strand:+ start:56 stop:1285 length:1230 start_codon:yes stop_codon:yes gene_type:complete